MSRHPRRLKVLEVIRPHLVESGEIPSYAQIATVLGWKNTGGVPDALSALVRLGYLKRERAPKGSPTRYTYELVG